MPAITMLVTLETEDDSKDIEVEVAYDYALSKNERDRASDIAREEASDD